jgi:hypothetical protein
MKTKLLTILTGLLLIGCEPMEVEPIVIEKTFTVKVGILSVETWEVEFYNLEPSETNPIKFSKFQTSTYKRSHEQLITTSEDLIVRVKHFADNATVYIQVFENDSLVVEKSGTGRYKEIYLNYEWE